MKIRQIAELYNPHGGINFVIDAFKKHGINKFLDEQLGKRKAPAQYSYSDVISAYSHLMLCGGERTEDMNTYFRALLETHPSLKVPSSDTMLDVLRSLSTETETITSDSGVTHKFNTNELLNQTLVRLLKKTEQLRPRRSYTLDYDNHIIETEKKDAVYTYKHTRGYQPGVAIIGEHVVYVENHNGNSPASYKQNETLGRIFKLLKAEGIKIKRCRMDAASFQKDVIDVSTENSKYFYIRAVRCEHMFEAINGITDWKNVTIGTVHYQIGSVEYEPFGEDTKYRLVVMRKLAADAQGNLFLKDEYEYRAILTNDWQWTDVKIVRFYNMRGAEEKVFDVMNNDFGWQKLPFSFLNENTVYLIIMAMCHALFMWIVELFSKKITFLDIKARLKRFVFDFISVSTKWVHRARQDILYIYTLKDYSPLAG